MRRRTPGLATVLLTLLVTLSSFSQPAAMAAPALPSSPSITPVPLPADAVPGTTWAQLSPQPSETGFTVTDYNAKFTIEPNSSSPAELPGYVDASGLSGARIDQLDPAKDKLYESARMVVTQGDGTTYTTPWSNWVVIWPAPAPEPPVVTPPDDTPAGCPAIQAFGLRGARQTTTDNATTDPTLQNFFAQLTKQIPQIRTSSVEYPMVSVDLTRLRRSYTPAYVAAVDQGGRQLRTALKDFWSTCPNTYVILSGYGPGAQAVGNVAENLTIRQQRHVAAIILLSDPRFNPKATAINVSQTDYNTKFFGSYRLVDKQLRRIPAELRSDTRSFCLKGDPICNFDPDTTGCPNPTNCSHLKYDSTGWTERAAIWAATHWRGLPSLT